MDGNEIIALARRTFVEEFVGFVKAMYSRHPKGVAEARTLVGEAGSLFGGHYRADFTLPAEGPGDKARVVEMVPDKRVTFDPLEGMAGATKVRMESLCWDDVAIAHDAPGDLAPLLGPWLERWYDPKDIRLTADPGQLPEVVHSLVVSPGKLVVDFGTASTDAFWQLVMLLRDAGAKLLVIRETRPLSKAQPAPKNKPTRSTG